MGADPHGVAGRAEDPGKEGHDQRDEQHPAEVGLEEAQQGVPHGSRNVAAQAQAGRLVEEEVPTRRQRGQEEQGDQGDPDGDPQQVPSAGRTATAMEATPMTSAVIGTAQPRSTIVLKRPEYLSTCCLVTIVIPSPLPPFDVMALSGIEQRDAALIELARRCC